MKRFITLLPLALLLTAQSGVAEPVLNIDADRVSIQPQGRNAGEVLQALAEKAGFELSGELEAAATVVDYALDDSLDKVIHQLASPQSVIIQYATDADGQRRVASVELLPTGDTDSQYLDDGKSVGFAPARGLTGDAEKDRHRLEQKRRRDERHAQGLGRRNQPGFGKGMSKEELQELRKSGQM